MLNLACIQITLEGQEEDSDRESCVSRCCSIKRWNFLSYPYLSKFSRLSSPQWSPSYHTFHSLLIWRLKRTTHTNLYHPTFFYSLQSPKMSDSETDEDSIALKVEYCPCKWCTCCSLDSQKKQLIPLYASIVHLTLADHRCAQTVPCPLSTANTAHATKINASRG